MATRVTRLPGASVFAPWAVFAGIVGVGLVVGLAASLAGAPALAAARDALARLADGDLLGLTVREARGLAVLFGVVVVQPLAVLAILLLIELWVGPGRRQPKNYLLTWLVQAVFLTFATFLGYAGAKLGLLPSRPLVRIEAAAGPVDLLLRTLPMYIAALFVADFFRYWFHRAQHHYPLLWRFHAVHHSPRDLDVLHNITHPVEQLGSLLLIAIPTAFLIGVDAGQLYVVSAFFAVHGHLIHMNVPVHFGPFRHLICDNRYHFLHHSRDRADFDTNFAGTFPVLDRMFGTYNRPKPGPLPATGLAEEHYPRRFAHYLLARWPGQDGGA